MKEVGDILKEFIEKRNMTQREVADSIHVSPQTLNNYIHKRRMPSIECFAALADLLEIEPSCFIETSYDKPTLSKYIEEGLSSLHLKQLESLALVVYDMNLANQEK